VKKGFPCCLSSRRFVSTVSSSDGGQRYQLPATLQQHKLLCSAERKPLMLLAVLQELRGQSTVIFASSIETTHRYGTTYAMSCAHLCSTLCTITQWLPLVVLHRLLLMLQAALEGAGPEGSQEVAEFSGTLSPAQRSAAIARFVSGRGLGCGLVLVWHP
jgi:superfamily II DNA/RNA helicase